MKEEVIKKLTKERLIEYLIKFFSLFSIISLAAISLLLLYESLPAFHETGFVAMFFGKEWYPTYDPASFGMLPLIWGSIFITLISIVIAAPLSLATAIYIHELASPKIKKIFKPTIEILASIPSVVYGLWGATFLAPIVAKTFSLPTGFNALTAGTVLAIMCVPIITTLCEDALNYVPVSFKEASYALGANRWQTLVRVTVPAASSGIINALILGIGRAIGETMVVLMVSGGAAVISFSIFDPTRPITSAIASEMGEASYQSLHYHTLFAAGFFLAVITLVLNIIAERFTEKFKIKLGKSR